MSEQNVWSLIEQYADAVHAYNEAVRIDVGIDKESAKCLAIEKELRASLAAPMPQAEPQESAEPSEKQRKLMELADRIDYERLCLRPGLTHRDMTPEQRDRMNAGVELRRYAQIWKADRWIVIPPTGPVRFSASTLDKAYEMAKKDEARND